MTDIMVEQAVIDFILTNKKDYRVSTSCSGPVVVPTEMKAPKESDLQIKVGDFILYISRVQARYISKVTADMLDPSRYLSCSYY
ncbi:hypothetical protein [Methanomassiliicoccus luminyensis]|uniref:hypothetical protein n=1 Tax=Methanomassiliicoccus luminyensis TaxID=1080712 RepID=UPI0003774937|nr:hypothetical protein [Methanomassiliicoccus luminyensis]